ncbi:MAG: guanylate kinase [Rickettsiales bacterium]|nr:guanylate kinase [Rickettsiales bacterium]
MSSPAKTACTNSGIRRGFMFVLSSPSGAGKTTLSRLLLQQETDVRMSVSVTTRPQRPGEKDGIDYRFVTQNMFQQMIIEDELLEHATVFGHSYGTPRHHVEEALLAGTDMLFDIDWQGTHQLKEKRPEDLASIFILPPSMAELENRLRKRAQDSDEVVRHRMAKAADEIVHWNEYDYIVINHDLTETLEQIRHILKAERLRRDRQTTLPAFVQRLCTERP